LTPDKLERHGVTSSFLTFARIWRADLAGGVGGGGAVSRQMSKMKM